MNDNILIEAVKNRRVISDKSHAGFKNTAIKDSVWLSVAEVVNASAADCISRWQTLRDRYTKEKRLMEAETRSGAGASNRAAWVHWTAICLLESHVRLRKSVNNFQDTSGNHSSWSPSLLSQYTSSSAEDDFQNIENGIPENESPAGSNAPCPADMPSTSAAKKTIASTRSAAASLPYFGSAGRCKKQKRDDTLEIFKETLINLREGIKEPAGQAPSVNDPDDLIGQTVSACLKNLTDPRTRLRYRRLFRDLVQDCEEAALD